MDDFLDLLSYLTLFLPVVFLALVLILMAFVIFSSILPTRSKHELAAKNKELREELCKLQGEQAALQEKLEQAQGLSEQTLTRLRQTFSEDIKAMLDRVPTGRLNRALQSNATIENFSAQIASSDSDKVYTVTLKNCTCPDYVGVPPYTRRNHLPCKHMMLLAYTIGILSLNEEETQKHRPRASDTFNESAEYRG